MAGSVLGAVGASVAGNVVGGLFGNDSSEDALDAQTAAADKAAQVQKYMYDTSREDLGPYRTTGVAANDRLSYLMGLSPQFNRGEIGNSLGFGDNSTTAVSFLIPGTTPGQIPTGTYYQSKTVNPGNGYYSIFDAGGNLVAYTRTPPTENSIYQRPVEGQQGITGKYTREQESLIDAEIEKRKSGSDYGSLAKKFTQADYVEDPGYKFRLSEGNKAINAAQAARGNFYSGAALKEANKYNSDQASQEYGNAYTRFNNDQNTLYSRLGGIADAGRGATNTAVGLNQNNANALSNIYGQVGNAQAANSINQGNNLSNMFSGVLGGGKSSYNFNAFPWSDVRLKENIRYQGMENGFPIYHFNYKSDPEKSVIRGVMAQDVMITRPDAVELDGEYYKVKYEKIGIEPARVH